MQEGAYRGTVKFFNTEKGFGFISPFDGELKEQLNGKDLFFHISAIPSDVRFSWEIKDGEEVEFTLGHGKKGPQAENVQPVMNSQTKIKVMVSSHPIEQIIGGSAAHVLTPYELLLFPKTSGQQWVVITQFQPLKFALLEGRMPAGYDNYNYYDWMLHHTSKQNMAVWRQSFINEIEKQLVLTLKGE